MSTNMSTNRRPRTWDETYRKAYIGDQFDAATLSITTALTDRLTIVSDVEITIRARGKASAQAEISLDAQSMRDLAALLETTADRVDELVTMRERLIADTETTA